MLRFVLALPPEAAPLVARYRLERDPRCEIFPVFHHPEDDIALIVSGHGKTAAAAATTFLHLWSGGERPAAWLNIGIAGHGTAASGELFLGHKIRDAASGRTFYPPLAFSPPCPSCEVVTVDRVEREYAEAVSYDMEASGFYEIATRLSTAETVHCLKVVSDGPRAHRGNPLLPETLDRLQVERLLADRLPQIAQVAAEARALAEEAHRLESDPERLAECLARWRFTLSEERRLRRRLRRWQAIAPPSAWPEEDLERARRGRDVLRILDAALARLPTVFDSASNRCA